MNIITSHLLEEVGDLLKNSVVDVFDTMLGMSVKIVEPREIRGENERFVAASVGFVGEVRGIVYLYLRESFARALAGRLLSLGESESCLEDDEITGDAIGELSNMIVGSVKSRLCDNGYPCTLTIPSVMRGKGLSASPASSTESLLLTIVCEDEPILLELTMKLHG